MAMALQNNANVGTIRLIFSKLHLASMIRSKGLGFLRKWIAKARKQGFLFLMHIGSQKTHATHAEKPILSFIWK
jgi:hypothetical protein